MLISNVIIYVAVAGRNGTLFLSLFDYYFHVYTLITLLLNIPESSNLSFNNTNPLY